MYKSNALELLLPCDKADEDGYCMEAGHPYKHTVHDSREQEEILPPVVYLPHSCGNWVIGGEKEILLLIEDLQKALREIKKHKEENE